MLLRLLHGIKLSGTRRQAFELKKYRQKIVNSSYNLKRRRKMSFFRERIRQVRRR